MHGSVVQRESNRNIVSLLKGEKQQILNNLDAEVYRPTPSGPWTWSLNTSHPGCQASEIGRPLIDSVCAHSDTYILKTACPLPRAFVSSEVWDCNEAHGHAWKWKPRHRSTTNQSKRDNGYTFEAHSTGTLPQPTGTFISMQSTPLSWVRFKRIQHKRSN